MQKSQNILCLNCNAVIHAEPCTVIVAPVEDPIQIDIDTAIAEMEHYDELYNGAKQRLKQLKKLVKQRIKSELKQPLKTEVLN